MANPTPLAALVRSLKATMWAVGLIGAAALLMLIGAVTWLDSLAVERHRSNFNQERTTITNIAARALGDSLNETLYPAHRAGRRTHLCPLQRGR